MSHYTSCSALNCINNTTNCSHTFFKYPKDVRRARVWVLNCQRRDLVEMLKKLYNSTYRVCGGHFEKRMFANCSGTKLWNSAVPTVFPAVNIFPHQSEDASTDDIKTEDPLSIESKDNKSSIFIKPESPSSDPLGDPLDTESVFIKEHYSDSEESAMTSINKQIPSPENMASGIFPKKVKIITHSKYTQTSDDLVMYAQKVVRLKRALECLETENFYLKRKIFKMEHADNEHC